MQLGLRAGLSFAAESFFPRDCYEKTKAGDNPGLR